MTTSTDAPTTPAPDPAEVPDDPTEPTTETPAETAPAEPDEPEKTDGLRAKTTARAAAVGAAFTEWSALHRRPPSLAEAWQLSGTASMDARRIPADSQFLAAIWFVSIRADRLVLFALAVLLLVAGGTLLWCVQRPSRRLGLLVVAGIVFAVHHAATGG